MTLATSLRATASKLMAKFGGTATPEGKTPEEVVAALATKACQDLKVGPYYAGSTPPQFTPDGTAYNLNWFDPNPPMETIDTTTDGEVTV